MSTISQPAPTIVVEPVSPAAVHLRVVFVRFDDRWSHRVESVVNGRAAAHYESIESAADQLWPASPPVQQVHCEDRPDPARVALCVGKAGKCHWSLSARLSEAGRQIEFAAACRVRGNAGPLGSTYRRLHLPEDRPRNVCIVVPSAGDAPTTHDAEDADRIAFRPLGNPPRPPGTVQWSYTIRLV